MELDHGIRSQCQLLDWILSGGNCVHLSCYYNNELAPRRQQYIVTYFRQRLPWPMFPHYISTYINCFFATWTQTCGKFHEVHRSTLKNISLFFGGRVGGGGFLPPGPKHVGGGGLFCHYHYHYIVKHHSQLYFRGAGGGGASTRHLKT